MSFTVRVLTAGVAAAAAAVAFAGNATAAPAGPRPVHGGQVFVQTDDPAGNSVAVYDRSRDGSLVPAGAYPTGGLGGVLQGAVDSGDRLDVFGVGRFGDLAARPVVTADPGAVPFVVAFDAAGRLDVAEAGTNSVASFRLNRDGSLTLLGRVATGQQATCWITRVRHSVYVMNAASGTVSTFAVHRDGLTGGALSATDPGAIDAAASSNGRYLYVQTGGTGTVDEFAIGRDGALSRIGSVTAASRPSKSSLQGPQARRCTATPG